MLINLHACSFRRRAAKSDSSAPRWRQASLLGPGVEFFQEFFYHIFVQLVLNSVFSLLNAPFERFFPIQVTQFPGFSILVTDLAAFINNLLHVLSNSFQRSMPKPIFLPTRLAVFCMLRASSVHSFCIFCCCWAYKRRMSPFSFSSAKQWIYIWVHAFLFHKISDIKWICRQREWVCFCWYNFPLLMKLSQGLYLIRVR